MQVLHVLIFALLCSLMAWSSPAADPVPAASPAPSAESFDEGLFEDTLPHAQGSKAKPGERILSMDATIKLHYLFSAPSSDNFIVTYTVHLEGAMPSKMALVRGTATIKADINGYLTKWSSGQCLLQVNVASVPFEITVAENGETAVKLGLQFKQTILEDWKSLCTFMDAPDSRFYTTGEPEKWISEALQKASPSLSAIEVPISETDKTTAKFSIARYSIKDGRIGSAEVDGSGTISITAPAPQPKDAAK